MTGVVAVDWDGTLVDPVSQEPLPGATVAFRQLLEEYRRVVVHTCRANWPEGKTLVEGRLAELFVSRPWRPALGTTIVVEPKVAADVYIDNLAVGFDGDWAKTLLRARQLLIGRKR